MITLASPSLAVNDSRSNMTLRMDYVVSTRPRDSIGYVINQIAARCAHQRLRNVVFNCHGNTARLQIGWGITLQSVPLFGRLRGQVDKIWFYSCAVASRREGLWFCAEVAKQAQAYVLASPENQHESIEEQTRGLPFNSLDTFEGKLISFDRTGRVNWTRRYAATGEANPS
jgi:hypothetical protein